MSNTPQPRQKKVRRLRGECLIEGLPTAAQIPLDGLRLRFDLRLEPASAAQTELSPLTEPLPPPGRGFTERIAERAFGVPGVYQRWAVLSGLATLALTLALWFFGAPPPGLDGNTDAGNPSGAASSENAQEPEPLATPAFSGGPSASAPTTVVAPPDGVGEVPATRPASPALVPTLRIAPQTSVLVSRRASAAPRPATGTDPAHQHPARAALTATGIVETTGLARPRAAQKPAAPRSVETDLLDLFADTK